jgi:hypothetical protein
LICIIFLIALSTKGLHYTSVDLALLCRIKVYILPLHICLFKKDEFFIAIQATPHHIQYIGQKPRETAVLRMTREQAKLYAELAKFAPGEPAPTLDLLSKRTGKCRSGISQMLDRMERNGVIKRHRGWRGIEVVEPPVHIAA